MAQTLAVPAEQVLLIEVGCLFWQQTSSLRKRFNRSLVVAGE